MLAMIAVTVMVTVAAVGWTVSLRVRRVFEKIDRERTADFVGQFRREYQHRADSVALSLDRMAGSEPVTRIAFELGHGGDPAPYLNRAAALSQEYQLDFLEIVSSDGSIVSSAQWPADSATRRPLSRARTVSHFSKKKAFRTVLRRSGCLPFARCAAVKRLYTWSGGQGLIANSLRVCPPLQGRRSFFIETSTQLSTLTAWSV